MEGTVGTEVYRGGYGRSPTALFVSSVISVASSPAINRPLVKRAVLVNGWEHPWGCPAETGAFSHLNATFVPKGRDNGWIGAWVDLQWAIFCGDGSQGSYARGTRVVRHEPPAWVALQGRISNVMAHDPVANTELLERARAGDAEAANQLSATLYDEFRALAASYLRRESPGNTLQPTALVHEAYLKLIDQRNVDWKGRTHFFAIGAQAMRRILVDHARARTRLKRGGSGQRILLTDDLTISQERDADLLAIDEALEKLREIDSRQAAIVEMRFFGGLTVEEVAQSLQVSKRTVEAEWTMVRAWLRRELSDGASEGDAAR